MQALRLHLPCLLNQQSFTPAVFLVDYFRTAMGRYVTLSLAYERIFYGPTFSAVVNAGERVGHLGEGISVVYILRHEYLMIQLWGF
jgi:hypothetical protein